MGVHAIRLLTIAGVFSQIKFSSGAPFVDAFKTDDFIRCKGVDCTVWDETQAILRELRQEKYTDDRKLADSYARLPGTGSYVIPPNSQNEADSTVEGDIWLSPEQTVYLKEQFANRRKRKMATFTTLSEKWDLPIKYYIDSAFDPEQRSAIVGATHHYESQTCITFQELTYLEALVENDQFLYFLKGESGCGTFIGRLNSLIARPQVIQLENTCILQWGAIVHEIGHTIGFWHEHQRSDRDNNVAVFPDRMKSTSDSNQYSKGITRDILPYDYGSVMHYWAWAFSGSLLNTTIEPKDPLYLYTIGQKIGLSFLDARLANIEYCTGQCSSPLLCSNNGYQNPKACRQCICPDGFEGTHCEQLARPKHAECGGTIRLGSDGESQGTYITSPGYTNGDIYEDRTECSWLIEAPEGHQVSLRFMNQSADHFGMYCRYPVCFHYVEVKLTSSDLSVTGPRFCCEHLPGRGAVLPGTLTSQGRLMMLLMRSNFTTEEPALKNGFRAYVYSTRDPVIPRPGVTDNPGRPAITPPPSPERTPALDVAFVMDSSGSVGQANWNRIKEFTKNIISRFALGYNDMRFGFVTFGSSGYVGIRLDDFDSIKNIHSKIDQLPWKRESSNIADGLRKARTEVFNPAAGDRSHVPNFAILLTDGRASAETRRTVPEAIHLKEDSKLMVIGVTSNVDAAELTTMASVPTSRYLKLIRDFPMLSYIEDDIVAAIELLAGGRSVTSPTSTTTATTPTPTTTTTETTSTTTTTEATTTTTTPPPQPANFEWACDFENDEFNVGGDCDLVTQEKIRDQFDWLRHSGKTPSEPTGPNGANAGAFYMYIETSGPRRNNDRATLYTAPVPTDGKYCLRFSYNMYGFHVNSLQVHMYRPSNDLIYVWSRTGELGARWHRESLSLTMSANSKIAFTGLSGRAYSGDIAIDSLQITSGPC